MQNWVGRLLVFFTAVAGLSWTNYLMHLEFEGFTVAMFLVLSLLLMAGMMSVALNGPRNRPPNGSDEIR